jgi:hypothetical protein
VISTVLRAPIRFTAESGEPVHAPVVLGTIGAIHTRLILDTGSDVHLVTRELAAAAGLDLTDPDVGTDHAGTELDSWLVGDVALSLDEATPAAAEIALRDVVAIPAPAAFIERGIGGILSPQRLHASAFAVIDELGDELVLLDADAEGVRGWVLARHPGIPVLLLERAPGDARPIVTAAIEPHPPVRVLVNTGGRHTEFEPSTVPGLAGGPLERIGVGVSGADVLGAEAGRQVLAIGGVRIALASLKLRTGMEDPPAMLGQDAIRGTVVAAGPDPTTPFLWQVAQLGREASEPSPTV